MSGILGQGPVKGENNIEQQKCRKKFNRRMLRCMIHSMPYIILALFILVDFLQTYYYNKHGFVHFVFNGSH